MPSIRVLRTALTLATSVAALSAPARVASATDDGAGVPVSSLQQEWVGLELTPVSVALASCCGSKGGTLDRFQAGPGGGVRFGRHRWGTRVHHPGRSRPLRHAAQQDNLRASRD